MLVDGEQFRTVWAEGPTFEEPVVAMIDQNKLPFRFQTFRAWHLEDTCQAIKVMTVRGAGAIGATAGFAMVQGIMEDDVEAARKMIEETRPTAKNLTYATKRVFEAAAKSPSSLSIARIEAEAIADEDAESCRRIGEHGAEQLIRDGQTVMTQCNAGWLAFVDWGSALSPIYVAKRSGMNVKVIANFTEPREQGARLTSWELLNEGIDCTVAPDTNLSFIMERGLVDLIIVGADRIAANGDTANKIGTQNVARIAKDFGIPFYVAAPTSTVDLECKTGADIPIEHRSQDEVLYKTGLTDDGRIERVLVAAPGSKALNPAFDVTPASLIAGIITQNGIFKPREITKAL